MVYKYKFTKGMIERIKKIMEHYQMPPASFADTLKINRATLSHLFAGRNNPSLDMALKILEAFPEINMEWLLKGNGVMLNNDTPFAERLKPEQVQEDMDLFSVAEAEIVQKYESPVLEVTKEEPEEVFPQEDVNKPVLESNNPVEIKPELPVLNSPQVKTVKKIVFFYEDKTFSEFYPEG